MIRDVERYEDLVFAGRCVDASYVSHMVGVHMSLSSPKVKPYTVAPTASRLPSRESKHPVEFPVVQAIVMLDVHVPMQRYSISMLQSSGDRARVPRVELGDCLHLVSRRS